MTVWEIVQTCAELGSHDSAVRVKVGLGLFEIKRISKERLGPFTEMTLELALDAENSAIADAIGAELMK
jgi:hypothetical protein